MTKQTCIYWDDWGVGSANSRIVQCQNHRSDYHRKIINYRDCISCAAGVFPGRKRKMKSAKGERPVKPRRTRRDARKVEKAN